MVHQRVPPSQESRPDRLEPVRTSDSSGRLRAACDSCHRAKVKCSGEDPCSSCAVSNLQCVYSPASRQGRPKGSKNKRTLMQERKAKVPEPLHEQQERGHSHQIQRKEIAGVSPLQQHRSMSANPNRDFAHDLGSFSAANHYLSDPDLLLSPQIDSSCLNTTSESYFDNGLSNLFAGNHNTRGHTSSLGDFNVFSAQPSYPTSHGASDSPCHDSGYTTGNTSPFPRDIPLFSPRGSASPGYAPRLSTSMSTPSPKSDHCSCLQQQAQLVYQLDDLKQSHDQNPTIDSVLQGVQLAQQPWHNLMRCSRFQGQDEQKEVFLLFALSIRTLLSLLRRTTLSSVGVSVGSYELSGKFKAKVMDQLSQEAIQSITSALRYLQDHTEPSSHLPSAKLAARHGTSWEPTNGTSFNALHEPQMHFRHQPMPLNMGAESVASLLETLQYTMQAMGQDLKKNS